MVVKDSKNMQRMRVSGCVILLMQTKLNPCMLQSADSTEVEDVAHDRL